jgi:hypothetical protein
MVVTLNNITCKKINIFINPKFKKDQTFEGMSFDTVGRKVYKEKLWEDKNGSDPLKIIII